MRLRGIDGCRAVAATLVVAFHAWDLGGRDAGFATWFLSRLWVGVPFFFALSGFLLYLPFAKATVARAPFPSVRRYGVARVARIVPGYWFCALTVLVVIGVPIIGATGLSVARDLFFLQIYDPRGPLPLVTPAWTLCLEVLFYATLPLLAWGVRRASHGEPARMVLVLLAVAAVGLLDGLPRGLQFVESLDQFAFGMIAAVFVAAGWPSKFAGLVGVVLLAVAFPLANGSSPLSTPLMSAGFALVVLHVARHPSTRLASRPLVALGVVSYGLFLWHYPVMQAARFLGVTSPAGLFAVAFPVALGFAIVSWFAVEKPSIRLGRSWRPRREKHELDHRVDGTVEDRVLDALVGKFSLLDERRDSLVLVADPYLSADPRRDS